MHTSLTHRYMGVCHTWYPKGSSRFQVLHTRVMSPGLGISTTSKTFVDYLKGTSDRASREARTVAHARQDDSLSLQMKVNRVALPQF